MEQEKSKELELTLNQRLKQWGAKLKNDVIVMYFALRHPLTPFYTKILVAIIVGYALSPIDLIPDFIPVLGYLDDAILLPLGISLVIRLIPSRVLGVCREEAKNNPPAMKPKMWVAYGIVLLWLIALYAMYDWIK